MGCSESTGPTITGIPDNGGGEVATGDNRAPSLNKIGEKIIEVGQQLVIEPKGSDPDGDALFYTLYGAPAEATWDPQAARFEWTPTHVTKAVHLTFRVSDGSESDQEVVVVRVEAETENLPPAFQPVSDQVLEVGKELALQLQASDPNGDTLTFGANNLPLGASLHEPTGQFLWKPLASQEGSTHAVEFSVTDGTAVANLTVRFFVLAPGQNKPPVWNPVGLQQAKVGTEFKVTVDATDPDGDALAYTAITIPTGAIFHEPSRSVIWTPTPGQGGQTHTLQFSVTDGTYHTLGELEIKVTKTGLQDGECTDDFFEPNNSQSLAKPISVGLYDELSVCDTTSSPQDQDWFEISLVTGQTLAITLTFTHSQGDLDIQVYNAAGQLVVEASSTTDNELLTYPINQPQTLYVRVFGVDQAVFNSAYVMEISTAGVACTDDNYEPNDTFVAARPLAKNEGAPNAEFCPGDLDFYKVSLQCGATLSASISFDNSKGDLDLYLYRASNQQLDVDSSKASTKSMETVFYEKAAIAEDLYILVTGKPAESTVNNYALTTQVTGSTLCTDDDGAGHDKLSARILKSPADEVDDLIACCAQDWYFVPLKLGEGMLIALKTANDKAFTVKLLDPDLQSVGVVAPDSTGLLAELESAAFSGNYYMVVEGQPGEVYGLEMVILENAGCASSKGCGNDQVCKVSTGQCLSASCSSAIACGEL